MPPGIKLLGLFIIISCGLLFTIQKKESKQSVNDYWAQVQWGHLYLSYVLTALCLKYECRLKYSVLYCYTSNFPHQFSFACFIGHRHTKDMLELNFNTKLPGNLNLNYPRSKYFPWATAAVHGPLELWWQLWNTNMIWHDSTLKFFFLLVINAPSCIIWEEFWILNLFIALNCTSINFYFYQFIYLFVLALENKLALARSLIKVNIKDPSSTRHAIY